MTRPTRRRAGVLVLAALLAATLAVSVPVADVGAVAAPDFTLPFPCGEPWHGTTRAGHSHRLAVDFNSYEGEEWEHGHPVLASATGIVLSAGFEVDYDNYGYTGFGNYVLIDHGGGWRTFYAHLSHIEPGIGPGEVVARGTHLGGVGTTGRAARNHLHYEQQLHGRVQRAVIDGELLPWGVDVVSTNCGPSTLCPALAVLPDVAIGTYYTEAAQWLADEEVTRGIGRTGLFFPAWTTTRAEVAAFLWRAAGGPETTGDHGFDDVPAGAFYAPAVAWLAASGVTSGVGGRVFGPDRTLTRAEMVTFLWRLAGLPTDHPDHDFPDVVAGSYHDDAVAWALDTGVTRGVGDTGRFMPHAAVTRAEVAVFLHRVAGSPAVTVVETCPG